MFQWKIKLDTMEDINGFVASVSAINSPVYLKSGEHLSLNAKSILGCCLAKMEWNDVVCQCDEDIYNRISKYTEE